QSESVVDFAAVGEDGLFLHTLDGAASADLGLAEIIQPADEVRRGGEQAGGADVGVVQEFSLVAVPILAIGIGPVVDDATVVHVEMSMGQVQRIEDALAAKIGK